jgi:hypothetical protein
MACQGQVAALAAGEGNYTIPSKEAGEYAHGQFMAAGSFRKAAKIGRPVCVSLSISIPPIRIDDTFLRATRWAAAAADQAKGPARKRGYLRVGAVGQPMPHKLLLEMECRYDLCALRKHKPRLRVRHRSPAHDR